MCSFRWAGSSEQPPDNILLEVKRLDMMKISSSLQSPLSVYWSFYKHLVGLGV